MKPFQMYGSYLGWGFLVITALGWGSYDPLDVESLEVRPREVGAEQMARISATNWWDPKPKAVPNGKVFKETRDLFNPIRIVIDVGHGGKDNGARGFYGVVEKDLSLKISRWIVQDLERKKWMASRPIEVKMTRDRDVFIPLRERVQIANDWGADLFISVHANSSPSNRARGFEIYFMSPDATDAEASALAKLENQNTHRVKSEVLSILNDAQLMNHIGESSAFAEGLYNKMSEQIDFPRRGLRQGPFTVLAETSMPAVLLEIGYLTHVEDARNLTQDSYLKRLASAISSGIIQFTVHMRKVS